MLSNVNKDLLAIMEVRNISSDIEDRIAKLYEEVGEFVDALRSGKLDDIADEGADVKNVIDITLLQHHIEPQAAQCRKLDKMNIETPFRPLEPSQDYVDNLDMAQMALDQAIARRGVFSG